MRRDTGPSLRPRKPSTRCASASRRSCSCHRSPITALGLRPGLGPSLLPADRYSYSYSYGRCENPFFAPEKTIHALRFSQSSQQLQLAGHLLAGLVRVYGDSRR